MVDHARVRPNQRLHARVARRAGPAPGPRRRGRSARRTGRGGAASRCGPRRSSPPPSPPRRGRSERHGSTGAAQRRGQQRRGHDRGSAPAAASRARVCRCPGVDPSGDRTPAAPACARPCAVRSSSAASAASESSTSSTSGLRSAHIGSPLVPRRRSRHSEAHVLELQHGGRPRAARPPRCRRRPRVHHHDPRAGQCRAAERSSAASSRSSCGSPSRASMSRARSRIGGRGRAPACVHRLQRKRGELPAGGRGVERARPSARPAAPQPPRVSAEPARRTRARRGGLGVARRIEPPAVRPRSPPGPPEAGATTGRPLASACSTTLPKGSRSAQWSRAPGVLKRLARIAKRAGEGHPSGQVRPRRAQSQGREQLLALPRPWAPGHRETKHRAASRAAIATASSARSGRFHGTIAPSRQRIGLGAGIATRRRTRPDRRPAA